MKKSVASIAKKVFDRIAKKFDLVIFEGNVVKSTQTAYDPVSGEYVETPVLHPCRVVFSIAKELPDQFPDYVRGASDTLVYLEGLSVVPQEADLLRVSGQPDRTIRIVGDIMNSGTFFAAVVR